MLSCRLLPWLSPLLFVWACSASHAPDDCDDGAYDFDLNMCVESVSGEPRDGGPTGRMRDAGRDARVRDRNDPGRDDEDDREVDDAADDAADDVNDGAPCRRGSTRKCQCSSGAYRDQMCSADRRWEACPCGGPPPLVFGDAGVLLDASLADSGAPEGGPAQVRWTGR